MEWKEFLKLALGVFFSTIGVIGILSELIPKKEIGMGLLVLYIALVAVGFALIAQYEG